MLDHVHALSSPWGRVVKSCSLGTSLKYNGKYFSFRKVYRIWMCMVPSLPTLVPDPDHLISGDYDLGGGESQFSLHLKLNISNVPFPKQLKPSHSPAGECVQRVHIPWYKNCIICGQYCAKIHCIRKICFQKQVQNCKFRQSCIRNCVYPQKIAFKCWWFFIRVLK